MNVSTPDLVELYFNFGRYLMISSSRPGAMAANLLPALPPQWPDGKVSGLRARGGFIIDMSWHDGVLTEARAESQAVRPLHLRYASRQMDSPTRPGETVSWNAEDSGSDRGSETWG